MREREEAETREREYCCWEIILLFLGFTFGPDSIYEEVAGFSPLWFPEENSLFLLSLVIIVVHVTLLDKILGSYCLKDKNITYIILYGIVSL